MNLRLVCRMLGVVAMLIGGTMIFSLPWAHPSLGHRGEVHDRIGIARELYDHLVTSGEETWQFLRHRKDAFA